MKRLIKYVSQAALVLVLLAAPLVLVSTGTVAAVEPKASICKGVTGAGGNGCGTTGGSSQLTGLIQQIVNVLLFVVGAVAVIVIIVGGLRYVLSGGDQSSVNSAKNTILYAVVGLIVALLAYAIVNFVVAAL